MGPLTLAHSLSLRVPLTSEPLAPSATALTCMGGGWYWSGRMPTTACRLCGGRQRSIFMVSATPLHLSRHPACLCLGALGNPGREQGDTRRIQLKR